jgi:hypothetical protein
MSLSSVLKINNNKNDINNSLKVTHLQLHELVETRLRRQPVR